MIVLTAANVENALPMGLSYLERHGVREDSRNGPVLVSPVPVTTVYQLPTQRVLQNPVRDANPFFHLFEAIWMLAGRNDVEFPAQFAKQIAEYTDDGSTIPGAYGHRWRTHFGYDQLPIIINELKTNPASRRCVLAMWDGTADQPDNEYTSFQFSPSDLHKAVSGGKDVPCNTHAYFRVNAGKLDMTVCNRSNDVVWGAYGANAVHFSILQEFVAAAVGVPVGLYYQIANNYHIYTDRPDVRRLLEANAYGYDMHRRSYVGEMFPLIDQHTESWQQFLSDCEAFCKDPHGYTPMTAFFNGVVRPMHSAITAHKAGDTPLATQELNQYDHDWAIAGSAWLERRMEAKRQKGLVQP